MATIDLSDMFFGIPLHPDSREITFPWQGKQYTFLGLPQVYLYNPITAHNTLMTLQDLQIDPQIQILTYVGDTLIMEDNEQVLERTLDKLITHLRTKGWTINQNKVTKPTTEVKFLGVHWYIQRPNIPETVVDKLKNLKVPKNKRGTTFNWLICILETAYSIFTNYLTTFI